MLRFRLFDVPYTVGVYFWIFAALLGQNVATGPNAILLLVVWVACAFVSVVVHELGHALSARYCGVQPAVELYTLGGVTRMSGRALTRTEGFWVTFCGPAAGFTLYLAIVAVSRWLYPRPDLGTTAGLAAGAAIQFLLWANLWWTVLNLLPILPLDGGLMLRSVLGPRHLKATEAVGVGLAGALAVVMAFQRQWYTALFLAYLAYVNFQGNPRSLPGATGG